MLIAIYWIFFIIISPACLFRSWIDKEKTKTKRYISCIAEYFYIGINSIYTLLTVNANNYMYHYSDSVFGTPLFSLYYIPMILSVITIIIIWMNIIRNGIYIIKYYGKMLSISVEDKEFSGEEIRLIEEDIIVRDGEHILSPREDYILLPDSYRNNIKRGEASVNIRLFNDYSGFYKVNFTIK